MAMRHDQTPDTLTRFRPVCIATLRAGVFGLAALSLALAATVWDANANPASNTAEAPVRLTPSVQIMGKNLTLGDVFENAGAYADRVIARAPAPGQSVTLEARWLARVARAFRLNWRPQSRYDTATVTRLSHHLSSEVIQSQVKAEILSLRVDLPPEEVEVQLDNRLLTLTLPTDRPATLAVRQLQVDPRTNRFSAMLASPAQPPYAVQVPVTGQLHRMVDVPVPADRILRGEIISANDLSYVRVRRNSLPANAILDVAELIGQSAKQSLTLGKPISLNAIQPPVLVKKGALVTVKLQSNNLLLTARGRAMQNGGLDDVIRVQNLQSSRTYDAIVTGSGQAKVSLPSQIALQ